MIAESDRTTINVGNFNVIDNTDVALLPKIAEQLSPSTERNERSRQIGSTNHGQRERETREKFHIFTQKIKKFSRPKNRISLSFHVSGWQQQSQAISLRDNRGAFPALDWTVPPKKSKKKTKPAETPKIKEEKKDEKVKSVARWEEDEPGFEPGLWSPFFFGRFSAIVLLLPNAELLRKKKNFSLLCEEISRTLALPARYPPSRWINFPTT